MSVTFLKLIFVISLETTFGQDLKVRWKRSRVRCCFC